MASLPTWIPCVSQFAIVHIRTGITEKASFCHSQNMRRHKIRSTFTKVQSTKYKVHSKVRHVPGPTWEKRWNVKQGSWRSCRGRDWTSNQASRVVQTPISVKGLEPHALWQQSLSAYPCRCFSDITIYEESDGPNECEIEMEMRPIITESEQTESARKCIFSEHVQGIPIDDRVQVQA
jgi:hypothetical protein